MGDYLLRNRDNMSAQKQQHHVILYQRFNRLPLQLPEVLHSRGLASQSVSSKEELLRTVKEVREPILLIDAGNNDFTAKKVAEELLEANRLYRYPLLFVGNDARSQEANLQEKFRLVVALRAPASNSDIIEALEYLVLSYERLKQEPDLEKKESTPFSERYQQIKQEAKEPAPHQSYQEYSTIPDFFFKQLDSSGLREVVFQAQIYTSGTLTPEKLRELGYFNLYSEQELAVERILKSADRWTTDHLCRTAFVATKFAQALNVDKDIIKLVVPSTFLQASAFVSTAPSLLRSNYIRGKKQLVRKDIGSRMKDSAMQVASELGSPQLGTILAAIGRFIAREDAVHDNALSVVASAIMGADLLDRVCFHTSFWDPRAAYQLLRSIKTGALSELHPRVMLCMIKFLSEAISTRPTEFLLPRKLRNNAASEEARELREAQPGKNERKIPLVNLMPGMKLSRPLHSFDGRKILSEELTLDQDLIWRLWQLSAVRPLNQPLVVISE